MTWCFSLLLLCWPCCWALARVLGSLPGWGQPCALCPSALSPMGDPDKTLFEGKSWSQALLRFCPRL